MVVREVQAGLYSVSEYFLARSAVDIPHQAFFPFVFGTIVFFLVGLEVGVQDLGAVYAEFIGNMLLMITAAASYGYLISASAKSLTGQAVKN